MGELWRVDYKSGAPRATKLPYDGAGFIGCTDSQTDGLLFGLISWTKSETFFAFDPKTQTAADTTLVPPITIDLSSIETASVKVTRNDCVIVSFVILFQRDLKRDGRNPTLPDA